jgi:hypothetical protein
MASPATMPPVPRAGLNTLVYLGELWKYIRKGRVKAGKGLRITQTDDGVIVSRLGSDETTAPHPFKITAEFDNPAAPTICLVSIAPGTLTGQLSGAGSYTGNPLFEGSGGAELGAVPAPEYDVGVTEQTTYFYLEVTTDNEGKIKNCWIKAIVAADVGTTAVDVPYVQEDFPAVGDPGSDGTYFHPIGSVTVSVSGSFPDFVYSVSTNNTLQSSAVFWPCGGAGIFDGFGVE